MFTANDARKIQNAIRDEKRCIPSIPDIMQRMTIIPAITSDCVPVYSMQFGDLTILVAVWLNDNGELSDVRVKFVAW